MKTQTAKLRMGAFTLVEMMIASGIGSIVLALAMTGTGLIERSFFASRFHATAQNDQLRISDFLAKDLRPATAVNITRSGQQVDLEIPAQDAPLLQVKLNVPVLDNILATPPKPNRKIRYTVQGQELYREESGRRVCLARNLKSFQAVRSGVAVTVSSSFVPQYSRKMTAAATEATTMRRSVLVRYATL
jgi:prepilin-type N-terminal cleavage/methylation domain-containing protein